LKVRVGTAPWLLQHELRLAWRGVGMRGPRGLMALALFGAAALLGLHGLVYLLLSRIQGVPLPPLALIGIGAGFWIVATLMLSQAMMQSVNVLFVRGDLDLLLASPLPPRSVFIVRGLGVALGCAAPYLLLLAPVADVGLITGRPGLLALYPALLALALAATALGIGVTLSLVRLMGARRARTAAQLLGGLVGAAFFLLAQAPNMLGGSNMARVGELVKQGLDSGGWLAADSALWLPGRAALGEPGPLAALLLLGTGGFWAVTRLAERRFLSGTQESVTGSALRGGGSVGQAPTRMRAGLSRNVLIKEWRLILRDPQLISQTLLQTLYLAPLMVVALRHQSTAAAIVPAAVGLAASLASSLSWITVAAEDAPELVGTAPVDAARLRWVKVAAALLPVWLLVSPLLAMLLLQDLWLAFVFTLCVGAGTVAAGALQVAYPRRGDRRDMKKRMQGSVLVGLLEAITTIAWAATAYCLISAWHWTPLPALFALLGPAATWVLGRDRRDGLV
jgi:ABC-2 type transport system permease protein